MAVFRPLLLIPKTPTGSMVPGTLVDQSAVSTRAGAGPPCAVTGTDARSHIPARRTVGSRAPRRPPRGRPSRASTDRRRSQPRPPSRALPAPPVGGQGDPAGGERDAL